VSERVCVCEYKSQRIERKINHKEKERNRTRRRGRRSRRRRRRKNLLTAPSSS